MCVVCFIKSYECNLASFLNVDYHTRLALIPLWIGTSVCFTLAYSNAVVHSICPGLPSGYIFFNMALFHKSKVSGLSAGNR